MPSSAAADARAPTSPWRTFLGNHRVVVCDPRIDHAYDGLYYLERACMAQIIALSSGLPLAPDEPAIAERNRRESARDRGPSELFFEALQRTL